jgi:predicted nucleic acid-binding protein
MHTTVAPARIATLFASLTTAALRRVQVRPLLTEAWAKRPNLTIADAVYVVLAEHLDATLVTSDLNLANAPTLTVPTIHQ